MSSSCIIPIVEGHGEVQAVPILLRRIWQEVVASETLLHVLKPLREKRMLMIREQEFSRFVQVALAKLKSRADCGKGLVLVLLDRDPDSDLPCQIAPPLLGFARQHIQHASVSVVVANIEYETWFVAAAESLGKYLELDSTLPVENPEQERKGKGWIAKRFKGVRYSETQDQPRLTSAMDLSLCRSRSRSFDKLCRDLEGWAMPALQK
jgi:hypothetical protein